MLHPAVSTQTKAKTLLEFLDEAKLRVNFNAFEQEYCTLNSNIQSLSKHVGEVCYKPMQVLSSLHNGEF